VAGHLARLGLPGLGERVQADGGVIRIEGQAARPLGVQTGPALPRFGCPAGPNRGGLCRLLMGNLAYILPYK
jgi:hypothetical protein